MAGLLSGFMAQGPNKKLRFIFPIQPWKAVVGVIELKKSQGVKITKIEE
jgi:hypothetical protein